MAHSTHHGEVQTLGFELGASMPEDSLPDPVRSYEGAQDVCKPMSVSTAIRCEVKTMCIRDRFRDGGKP
ncbi:hypothetical protein PILCRDRAFT_811614 [Piloderma croceum F 1598]|uniref:Uncharacterized protein n=1 Tax=Piloderma croceum (strain F 1598) TaxID=765440 RepID=A0A0C3BX78_PILCF|nr:hypothetical protein PILCRDRAFT_811614 [Piloderma croceum F 1598]